ncbi:MAG: hypothetical protein AB6733_13040 [Clostridiaceae bacterium]
MKKIIFSIVALAIVISSGFIIFYVKQHNGIVARYVTDEHYRYSPVELNGDIYFPSNYNFQEHKKLKSIGHLGVRNKSFINDILLDTGDVLVEDEDNNYLHFTVQDDNTMTYSSAKFLQESDYIKNNMDAYNKFVLCNDNDSNETRITIKKEMLNKIQEEFKIVKYNLEDFKNCDDIYYIYVDSPKEKIHGRTFDNPIIYMGCILVKGDNFYYGNLTNEIKGDLKSELREYIK